MSDAVDKTIVPESDDGMLPLDDKPETKTIPSEPKAQDFVEQVNQAVSLLVEQEDGTFALPEDQEFSPEMRYAVVSEKRRRDAQSALNKSQHANKTTQKEVDALKKRLQGKAQINLSTEEQEELEELKFSNPDAWRQKLNEYETRATEEANNELAEVSDEVTLNGELDRRATVLAEFNAENPDSPITDEVIMNDIPPRITNKLRKGEVSFEDFLVEVNKYRATGKVIKNEEILDQPNLGTVGGSDKVLDSTVDKDSLASYENETY